MHNKVIAGSPVKKTICIPKKIDEGGLLISMLYTLNSNLRCNPNIYIENSDTIWIYYPYSFEMCYNIIEEYGEMAALISRRYPISIYGNCENGETAELSMELLEDEEMISIRLRIFV